MDGKLLLWKPRGDGIPILQLHLASALGVQLARDQLLDPLNKWILEVCKAHSELGERLVEAEAILVVQLAMVIDTNAPNLHEVLQEALRGLARQVANDERIGLDVSDQLLLLLQDVLEVVQIALRIGLVHELFDQTLL